MIRRDFLGSLMAFLAIPSRRLPSDRWARYGRLWRLKGHDGEFLGVVCEDAPCYRYRAFYAQISRHPSEIKRGFYSVTEAKLWVETTSSRER